MGKKRVKPETYEKFIDTLSLEEIRIVSLKAKVDDKFAPPAEVRIDDKMEFTKLKDNAFIVTHEYILKCYQKGKKKTGLEIAVTFQVKYRSDISIYEEIFDIFSQSSVPLHTWPYFRQLVHEITGRMGLPPLILDVLKVMTS